MSNNANIRVLEPAQRDNYDNNSGYSFRFANICPHNWFTSDAFRKQQTITAQFELP